MCLFLNLYTLCIGAIGLAGLYPPETGSPRPGNVGAAQISQKVGLEAFDFSGKQGSTLGFEEGGSDHKGVGALLPAEASRM